MDDKIRLQKYLADCGVASRRAAEGLIDKGKVTVNGEIAKIGAKVTADVDEVRLDGKLVSSRGDAAFVYIALNKPVGVISAVKDQFGRTTVMDFVSADVGGRLFPVGRLDYATSGLIILTNDGYVTYKLTHPGFSVEKVYTAVLKRPPNASYVKAFRQGIAIEDYTTRPANLEINGNLARVTLKEGRNRQVRKMFESLGNEVVSLQRVAIGPIALNGLKSGCFRHLTEDEVGYLKTL